MSSEWDTDYQESLTLPTGGGPDRIDINVGNNGTIDIYQGGVLVEQITPNGGFLSFDPGDPLIYSALQSGGWYLFRHSSTGPNSVLSGSGDHTGRLGWGLTLTGYPYERNVAPAVNANVYIYGDSDTYPATVLLEATSVQTSVSIDLEDPGNPGVPLGWTPLTYANGWTDVGGAGPVGSYRITPDHCVHVVATIQGGTNADTTRIATLAGITPLSTVYGPCYATGTAAGATQSPAVTLNASAQLRLQGCAGATILGINYKYPLDL